MPKQTPVRGDHLQTYLGFNKKWNKNGQWQSQDDIPESIEKVGTVFEEDYHNLREKNYSYLSSSDNKTSCPQQLVFVLVLF